MRMTMDDSAQTGVWWNFYRESTREMPTPICARGVPQVLPRPKFGAGGANCHVVGITFVLNSIDAHDNLREGVGT